MAHPLRRLIRPAFGAYESAAKIVRRARWPLTIGVRVAVTDTDNRVLLVRHTYVAGWHFPGGGINKREAAERAAAREVLEETQIELTAPATLHGVYLNLAQIKSDHILFFTASQWKRIDAPARPLEIVEAKFFPMRELPEGATGGTRRRIAELLGDAKREAMW